VSVEPRGAVEEVKKIKSTKLAPTAPAGLAIGDLVIIACLSIPTVASAGPFAFTTPAGWTQFTAGKAEFTEGTSKMAAQVFYKIITSATLPEIEAAGECTIDLMTFAFKGGSFGSTEPLAAQSAAWKTGGEGATGNVSSIGGAGVNAGSYAVEMVQGKGATSASTAGWSVLKENINSFAWTPASGMPASGEITGTFVYLKTTAKIVSGLAFVVQALPQKPLPMMV
jgi:hypothetical protein